MSSLTSKRPSTSAEQRLQDYRALMAIIVSGVHGTDSQESEFSGSTFRLPDLDALTTVNSIPATTAHCIVRQGIPSRSLVALGEYLGIGKGALAELVDLDRATAFRKVAVEKPLPMHAAESVLRLLELNQLAEDTFETPEEAAAWLRRGHPMLGDESPLDWARTAYGAERVKEILIAVKYGGAV